MLSRTLPILLALAAAVAGCVTPPAASVEPAGEAADAALGMPMTEVFEGDIVLSAALPVRTVNYGGSFLTFFELEDNTTGFILELEWEAAGPASESLSMWVRPAGDGSITVPPEPSFVLGSGEPLAKVDGASPLRLVLPIDAFPEKGAYDVVVRAAAQPAGAAANQPFTLHMTGFHGIAFDEEHSALGEHAHE